MHSIGYPLRLKFLFIYLFLFYLFIYLFITFFLVQVSLTCHQQFFESSRYWGFIYASQLINLHTSFAHRISLLGFLSFVPLLFRFYFIFSTAVA